MHNLPVSGNGNTPIDVAITAIRKSGDYIRKNIYSTKVVSNKGYNNLVTNFDVNSEKIIIDVLRDGYPEWEIMSEESSPDNNSDNYSWIIDPIDGTTNFVHGIPFIAINIALKYKDDILLGVTYDPFRDELFQAQKGKGTFLNAHTVNISKEHDIRKAVVSCDLGYDSDRGIESLDILHNLWGSIFCIRIIGSAALGLAYVASGRLDIYFHRSVYPWDISSGILLINESGGEVRQWECKNGSNSTSYIIAANKHLISQFERYFKV
jgi:myo-inositol-1(or 4)-monophosphatase